MSDTGPARQGACPICGKPAQREHAPFCSARCKRIDLGRWLNEVYIVPGGENAEEAEDSDEDGATG